MVSFHPLVTILNQNKLFGSYYVDWKRDLDIVLTAEEHKFVLNQPCPNFPSLDAPSEEKQQYDRWQKSNEMAKCYTLAFISNVLQHQMQDVELPSDIMLSLKEMFDVFGANIDGESQADMILQSLPESPKEFRLNYNVNKKIYTLSKLMNELVIAEGILGKANVATNMAEASSSKPKSKGKGSKKKKDFTKQDGVPGDQKAE
ncbi:uncharacterized protein LOC115965017 [Quercus lobata]|uniref:uncharacterized protein LOC115965017 n=1 Tax=Quercus lobata TaxID=97700 RepID=UPI001247CCD4|nr:uncharacterized protein LOC115965017 [Quercus lobata]